MEGFFKGLPDRPNAAFVIVTHLSPARDSVLHEVIGRFTRMPVVVAEDDMKVEPGHVYVMPPNAILTIDQGRLRIRQPRVEGRERKPVDLFLASLAHDQGNTRQPSSFPAAMATARSARER